MIRLFLVLVVFGAQLSTAQSAVSALQQEIDETVWKPFQKAFEDLDATALNAIYAQKVLRVTPNGIDTEEAFKQGNNKRFAMFKTEGVKIQLDFWIDSRHTNAITSYEVGFYRIAATTKKETTYSYGQFHIVLKKDMGVWKITQDWDTTVVNGKTIDAEDFERKPILQF